MKTKRTIHIQTSNHTETSERKQQETLKEHSNEFQIDQFQWRHTSDQTRYEVMKKLSRPIKRRNGCQNTLDKIYDANNR